MGKTNFVYTGCENLEAMAEAKKYNAFLTRLVTYTVKNKGCRILDFGAGTGTYADLMKEGGFIVDCVEPDKTLQSILKQKGYTVFSDVKKIKSKSYDVIYTFNVLEHIEDDANAFKDLSLALKPGGSAVIYLPAFQVLFSTMDERVEHFRRYRKSRLKNFAIQSNLEITKLRYCDPIGFFAALVYKFAGKKDGTISPASIRFYDTFVFPLSHIIEYVTHPFFGKNVVMTVVKPKVK